MKELSAASINARLAALKKFNDFLIARGFQSDFVVTDKNKIKIQKKYASPAEFEEREVNRFVQAVIEGKNVRDYCLITLLMYTGCRISEALNIVIERDLFLKSQELVVRTGKGDKERTILLHHKVIDAIKDYVKEREKLRFFRSPFLFLSNKGERLSRLSANDIFKKYSLKAGLEKHLTPHDLRHYFCSHALENGFDVHEVANMAGHSNIHTTLLYTNPSRQKMIDKLNRL